MRDDEDGRRGTGSAPSDAPSEAELRAKYLEYCSARISEVFLSLSDEKTYALLEEAARESGADLASLGFQSKMQMVTGKLRESVPLPDFESWSAEYLEHPERVEPFLLGLWKEAVEPESTDPGSEES